MEVIQSRPLSLARHPTDTATPNLAQTDFRFGAGAIVDCTATGRPVYFGRAV
jgi:hypothetical protein